MVLGPAVAMGAFMAAIGVQVLHRAAARNDEIAGAADLPGTGVGVNAAMRAGGARLLERQDALDHRAGIGVIVALWRFEDIDRNGS